MRSAAVNAVAERSIDSSAPPLAILGAGLDPVVLGGVRHPTYPAVTWCVLAQWEWE